MHKKTLNIASVCFVAILVAFVVTQKEKTSDKLSSNIEVENSSSTAVLSSTESYQQEIMKTVLDQNLKAFESVSNSFKKQPTDTLSDTISKNVFSQYIEYNTSKSLDVDTIQKETINALKEHPVQKSNIGLQDIRISANSVANLREYGNTVGMIQTAMIEAIQKIQNKENPNIYIKNIYKTVSNLYLKQAVPESLAKDHLRVINGYKDYANAFELLELQSTDPAKALSGVQLAKEAQDALVASLVSIKNIVVLNKIVYSKGEPAYIWFIEETGTQQIKTN